jgi:hyaluronan synthase/N-acetylglucosaminyltransferase
MTGVGIQVTQDVLRFVFLAYTALVVSHFVLQVGFAHSAWRRSVARGKAEADIEQAAYLPSVDVIVPVYNEDPKALDACCRALAGQDYKGQLRVYLIDDGSANRAALLEVYRRYRPRRDWRVLLADANAGKRAAQDLAYRRGRGDLVVTIDSDTEVSPDGISTIVGVFRDPKVGAVTGNVGVSNFSENLLTRLIGMRYWLAFNQERAAQGRFGAVLCCSGPFSVYRREALDTVWEAYTTQTFRGVACTYGDDRHLTNLILAEGYHTVYEPRADARTNVPTKMRTYLHQQLRWNKSYYRELLWTFPFLFKRPPYLVFDVLTQTLLPLLLTAAVVSAVASAILVSPVHLLRYVAAISLMALLHVGYAVWRTRDPRFALFVSYGFLHAALLIPLRVRALSTLTDNRWGTRLLARAMARTRAATAR